MYIPNIASHYEWQVPAVYCRSEEPPSSQEGVLQTSPYLILYFDMNKTLIASDREGGKTAHDVISAEIADRVVGYWDDSLLIPVSYANYVKRTLLPNPNNSKEVKLQQKEKISNVLQFLKQNKHPDYDKLQKTYARAIGALESQKTLIFKSFYRLIEFLEEKEVPYTLVIRTFGSEGSEVAEELNQCFGKEFMADFRTLRRGHLNGSEEDLYKLVTNANHHLLVQDDWDWWFSHGQNWKYGKPFPIDLENSNYVSLFFDDNAGIDLLAPEENIIFPYNAVNGEPIPPSELIDGGQLIPVEMLKALCDEDYYIRYIEKWIDHSYPSAGASHHTSKEEKLSFIG